MEKKPFVTKEQLDEIVKKYPTPFHLYDEKGIRENAEAVKEAFAWNPGFREYFAVKATPNPFILNILKEYDCGCDCSFVTNGFFSINSAAFRHVFSYSLILLLSGFSTFPAVCDILLDLFIQINIKFLHEL